MTVPPNIVSSAGVIGVTLVAVAIRLYVGLHTSLDGDESVEAIAALHILNGHLVLMESDAHYLGALDSYLLAPFVAVFGTTLLAVRLCFSLVGGAYTVAMYFLGRAIFKDSAKALIMALVCAVFPLFAITYGIRARTYGVLLLIEALLLLLTIRIAWPLTPALSPAVGRASNGPPVRRRQWLLLGLLAGIALWHDVLLAIPLVVCVLLLLARESVMGIRELAPRFLGAAAAAVVGFSPWLVYNATTRLGSLRHLYTPLSVYSVSTATAARQVLSAALPIFVGARVNGCGPETVPSWVVGLGLLLLAGVVVWLRRASLRLALRGQFAQVEPADWVLLIAPLALLAVTVHFFNSVSCEPRYLMPFAVPLVLAIVLVLSPSPRPSPRKRGEGDPQRALIRAAGIALLLGCLLMSLLTYRTYLELRENLLVVPGAPHIRLNMPEAAAALVRQHPGPVWAQYWLARPIEYYSADQFPVGAYGGYVGFADIQAQVLAAPNPSWLFIDGDPEAAAFEAACKQRGITYKRVSLVPGLVLYEQLSGRVSPDDLGIKTQTVRQAA